MKKKWLTQICILLFLSTFFFQSHKADAHSGSVGYSDIKIVGNQINYDLFLLGDLLGGFLNIDKNQDGYMKEDEIHEVAPEIEQFVLKNLSVINNGIKGEPIVRNIQLTERWNYPMFQITLEFTFDEPIEEYEIDYNIFFHEIDKSHQNFATISDGSKVIEYVFTKDHIIFQSHLSSNTGKVAPSDSENTQDVDEKAMAEESSTDTQTADDRLGFQDYFVMGMKHIWSGIDHLLFLLGLLLLKGNYKDYLKILTAFTVGHSITLALAASETLIIPSSIIEPLIALSIIYVAVENIWAKSIRWRWVITLFFGLIHGFGFAEVLIGRLGDNMFLPLFSFNLGVEIGQVVVLILIFPLIWYLRKLRWQTQMLHSTSAIISLIGLYWFIVRVL